MHRTMSKKLKIFLFLFLIPFSSSFASTDKDLPRFATTRSDHVNARKGPGVSYPIDWVFIRKGEPVKITAEFEDWRKTEDINGSVGWVHSSVLSIKRSVVITCPNKCNLLKKAKSDSKIVATLENGLRCSFDKVDGEFCKVKCDGYKGFIEIENTWGILEIEASDE